MNTLKKSVVNKYAFYGFGQAVGVMVPMTYISVFMTENLLMSAALMGTVLLVSRIIDFIFGVTAGGIIEKTKMKWGKYRSWLIVLKWVILIGVFLMFFDSSALHIAAKVTISIVAYTMVNASLNFTQTAQFGIMSLISGPSMDNRNNLSIRNAQYMAAAQIATSAATIPLINLLTPLVGQSMGYLIVGVAFALVLVASCGVLTKLAEPYDIPQITNNPGAPVVSVGDIVKSVVTNGQLLIVLTANILFNTGMMVSMGIMAYYYIYVLGNFTLMAVGMTITTVFGLVASMFAPKIAVKLGKKNAMIVGLLIYALSNVAIVLFGGVSLTVYIVFACLYTTGMYFFMGFGPNYFLDCAEYGLWKTGKDNRAVAMSLMNVPIKIGMALGGAIGGYGLAIIGYTAGMMPTPEFTSKFMILFGGAPAALTFLAAMLMLLGYKLKDEDCKKYAEENAAKMQSMTGISPE
ncbi:MAG: MFS transporter [Eubacteriaceae bacterium]